MIYKCKMCGGDLEISGNEKTVVCPFCGTNQTIPNVDEEKMLQLYNRASFLRSVNEYDKASNIYEKIIADQEEQAEAYWGLCLCKYGIEYVDDPKTNKRIPTCHRTESTSILKDKDYLKAVELADVVAKNLYKEEATYIDSVQKRIIEISNSEDPYDIFICYKETDEAKQRTIDSVIAEEIYDVLTDKGFRVFFSKISLEDKIGQEYEPFIYAALNSSKVMLVIGTKEQYFNAPWVKNEWGRFLSLNSKDKSKILIPCYKNISPYEMPEEFVNLQAQDLDKIGYLQDLTKGIQKLFGKRTSRGVANSETSVSIAEKLAKANTYISSKEFKEADQLADEVLLLDPKNAFAYVIKFKVDCKMSSKNLSSSFIGGRVSFYGNFTKAYELADDALKEELESFRDEYEGSQNYDKYRKAKDIKDNAISIDDYREALSLFKKLGNYSDSKKLINECISAINSEKDYLFLGSRLSKCIKPFMNNKEKINLLEAFKKYQTISKDEEIAKLIDECDVDLSIENTQKLLEDICKLEKDIENFYSLPDYINLNDEYTQKNESIKKEIDILAKSSKEKAKNLEQEKTNLRQQLMDLNTQLGKCGIFQGKQKRELQSKISFLEKEYEDVKKQLLVSSSNSAADNISQLKNKQLTIEHEYNSSLLTLKNRYSIVEKEDALVSKKKEYDSLKRAKNKSPLWNPKPIWKCKDRVGFNILFATLGQYPQDKVTSNDIIKKLDKQKPNEDSIVTLDGLDYLKVDSEYFLMMPIDWQVISCHEDKKTGKKLLFLISRYALDYMSVIDLESIEMIDKGEDIVFLNKETGKPACLYRDSTIDKWLNEYFYRIAFNEEEKKLICKAFVDNSAESGIGGCDIISDGNCERKVFLPSYQAIKSYDFANNSLPKHESYVTNIDSLLIEISSYNLVMFGILCQEVGLDYKSVDVDESYSKWATEYEAAHNSEHYILKNSDLVAYKYGNFYCNEGWGIFNEDGSRCIYDSPDWALRTPLPGEIGLCGVNTNDAVIYPEQDNQFEEYPDSIKKLAIRPAIVVCFDGAPDEVVVGEEGFIF